MLSKEEFAEKLMINVDEMYAAYTKAEEEPVESPADALLRRRNDLPGFVASDPVLTDDEKKEMNLKPYTETEVKENMKAKS